MPHSPMCNISKWTQNSFVVLIKRQHWHKDQQPLLLSSCPRKGPTIKHRSKMPQSPSLYHKWTFQQDGALAHTAHNTIQWTIWKKKTSTSSSLTCAPKQPWSQTQSRRLRCLGCPLATSLSITDENSARCGGTAEDSNNHWVSKTITTCHW